MALDDWSAGRWILLLSITFLVGAFLAIGVFFRLSGDGYAVSEASRGTIAVLLGGGVVASWLLLAISSGLPQWRSAAFLLLIGAFLANMAVPSFLPTNAPPTSGSE